MKIYFDKHQEITGAAPSPLSHTGVCAARNQEGSVIVIALMVLVIMTVIGLMSSRTVVTENFIIRNQGIYKQNIYMTEAALMEGLQLFMQIPDEDPDIDPANITNNVSSRVWINDIRDPIFDTEGGTAIWYTPDSSARILDPGNSFAVNSSQTLADRGETGSGNLRTGFVGWEIETLAGGGSESLVIGNRPIRRKGRLLAEYVSNAGSGLMRMEIGVRRIFRPN